MPPEIEFIIVVSSELQMEEYDAKGYHAQQLISDYIHLVLS